MGGAAAPPYQTKSELTGTGKLEPMKETEI
jgi:hypothetical protein